MNFDDPENTQNYYLIETYSVNEYLVIKNSDTTEYELDTTKQFMVLTDEVFQNGGSPWREQGLFNDLLFNGQNKTLELEIPNDSWNGSEDGYDWSYQTLTLRLYLHNITLSYYYYRTSLELFQMLQETLLLNQFKFTVTLKMDLEYFGSQISFFDL